LPVGQHPPAGHGTRAVRVCVCYVSSVRDGVHVRLSISTASMAGPDTSMVGRGKQQEKYFFHVDRLALAASMRLAASPPTPSRGTPSAPTSTPAPAPAPAPAPPPAAPSPAFDSPAASRGTTREDGEDKLPTPAPAGRPLPRFVGEVAMVAADCLDTGRDVPQRIHEQLSESNYTPAWDSRVPQGTVSQLTPSAGPQCPPPSAMDGDGKQSGRPRDKLRPSPEGVLSSRDCDFDQRIFLP
jgi:hypothetical protein